jgi:hypothetical protein
MQKFLASDKLAHQDHCIQMHPWWVAVEEIDRLVKAASATVVY